MSLKRRIERIEKSIGLDSYVIIIEDTLRPEKTKKEAENLRKFGNRVIVFEEDDMRS